MTTLLYTIEQAQASKDSASAQAAQLRAQFANYLLAMKSPEKRREAIVADARSSLERKCKDEGAEYMTAFRAMTISVSDTENGLFKVQVADKTPEKVKLVCDTITHIGRNYTSRIITPVCKGTATFPAKYKPRVINVMGLRFGERSEKPFDAAKLAQRIDNRVNNLLDGLTPSQKAQVNKLRRA